MSALTFSKGIILEEEPMFEGIVRPQAILVMGENAAKSPEDVAVLERYFNDIANLFQKKFLVFSSEGDTSASGEDSAKLRSLLDEIIKVKTLIVKAGN
jgi:hypothetical protein